MVVTDYVLKKAKLRKLRLAGENYTDKISDNAHYVGYGFKFTAPDSVFENIDSVN